jgi:hypothetical protein
MKKLLIALFSIVSAIVHAQPNPIDNIGTDLATVGDVYASEAFLPCVSEQNGVISNLTARLNLYTQNLEYVKDGKTFLVKKYARVCLTEDTNKRCFVKLLNLDKVTKVGLVEEIFSTSKGFLGLWRTAIASELMDYGAEKRFQLSLLTNW